MALSDFQYNQKARMALSCAGFLTESAVCGLGGAHLNMFGTVSAIYFE